MNNSKTPKIVVGVALVAVYATGLAVFTLRGKHDSVVAQSPPAAVSAPIAAAPALIPEASPPAATPAPSAGVSAVANAPQATRVLVASEPKSRTEVPVARVAASTPLARSETEESGVSNPGSAAANESAAIVAAVAGESVSAATDAPAGKDSQITADVKSKVQAVAPEGAIDVTTRDGVVELAGSVPSQDVFDKARLAARNVRDVRDVDVSALTIAN